MADAAPAPQDVERHTEQEWIRLALSAAVKQTPPGSDRVHLAWEMLANRRQPEPYWYDYQLANAEHYMFARYMATLTNNMTVNYAVGGIMSAGAIGAVVGYDAVKWVALKAGLMKKVEAGKGPALPPTPASLDWGSLGAIDATLDPTGTNYYPLNPKQK